MRRLMTPCLLLALAYGAVQGTRTAHDEVRMFEDFKLTYGRLYSPSEEVRRFGCFRRMLDLIDERNKADPRAVHSVNQFTDLCPEEFAATFGRGYRGSHSPNATRSAAKAGPVAATGRKINWSQKGAVTPVKNQGQCGDCYAFTAVGNMESVWQIAGNPLVGLSEEQIVECATKEGILGCNGGLMVESYEYVLKNGGINSESSYPYTSGFGETGECKEQRTKASVAHFSGYKRLPHNETLMADWVYKHGPISVAVNSFPFQTYSGGILSDCPKKPVTFSVVIVGFDDAYTTPYWIIKNSFGTSWGEMGYARIKKGIDACGITLDPSTILA